MHGALQLRGRERQSYTYWESKKAFPTTLNGTLPVPDLVQDTVQLLAHYISYVPFADSPFLFGLNFKMRTPREVIMNEMIAIYVIMFYLGSLVRYRPESQKKCWKKRGVDD